MISELSYTYKIKGHKHIWNYSTVQVSYYMIGKEMRVIWLISCLTVVKVRMWIATIHLCAWACVGSHVNTAPMTNLIRKLNWVSWGCTWRACFFLLQEIKYGVTWNSFEWEADLSQIFIYQYRKEITVQKPKDIVQVYTHTSCIDFTVVEIKLILKFYYNVTVNV